MRTFERKALTRDRRSVFSVFTALAAVAVFAACSYPAGSAAEAEALSAPAGLVYARVALPAGGGGGVRPCFPVFSKQRHPL
ncbi:MAG: hypothetical protein LBU18_00330 [Treponema sp.]|jgi:hypothetical protein|nr:hypothetical protein [Treponema sp.]